MIWGGSYEVDILKLENIHLDAMRLIVGATSRSNIVNTIEEFGGYSIIDRINQSSLLMMFKIINGMAPQYLNNILTDLNGPRNYALRNNANIRVPLCRLETYKRSFFPRAIQLWNDLPEVKKSIATLEGFKMSFNTEKSDLLLLYYFGERWPSVHHARMRIGCSKLNGDLFTYLHVIDNPLCTCGAHYEDANHFFNHCPQFTYAREKMFNSLNDLLPLNVHVLLFGSTDLSIESNKRVFKAVHQFILDSNRF